LKKTSEDVTKEGQSLCVSGVFPPPVLPSAILVFWTSIGDRPCVIASQGTFTYAELVQALQQPMQGSVSRTFNWTSLLCLLSAALRNEPFAFASVGRSGQRSSGLWLQTTGTTGEPKWVQHSWKSWLGQYRWKDGGEKSLLQVMAFDHIGGLHGIFSALSRGMTLVVPAGKDGTSVKTALQQHRVFLLPTTPSHLALLLESGCFEEPLPHLRMISYGAEAMSPDLKQSICALQPHLRWRETYGSTETGILSLQSGSEPGSWQPNFPYKVVEGELHTQNLQGEWLATGDFVEELGWGRLRFLGRKAARIKVGGILVAPEQTAAWLRQQANVWQVRVEAVAHPLLGQVLEARLWVAEGADVVQLEKQFRNSFPVDFPKEAKPVRYTFEKKVGLNKRLKKGEAGSEKEEAGSEKEDA